MEAKNIYRHPLDNKIIYKIFSVPKKIYNSNIRMCINQSNQLQRY